jgi:hypothetical protein
MRADLTEAGDRLELSCTGRYTQADLLQLIDMIAEARGRNPQVRKCLMDALNAEVDLGGLGEFFVGEYAAKKLAGLKVCLLIPSGQVTNLLENTAYNRGLKILLAASRSEADAWLAH